MERNTRLDIVRGLLISLVVLGHCGCPLTHFIYLFHVAVFFMVSGFVYKSDYSNSYSTLILFFRKKIKRLWIPFFFFTTFFTLNWNFLVKFNLYDSNVVSYSFLAKKIFLNLFLVGGNVPMCGALWFVSSLFYISLIYVLIDFFLKKIKSPYKNFIHICFAATLFSLNLFFIKKGIQSSFLKTILGPYIMYALGVEFSKSKLKTIRKEFFLPILVISFIILLLCNNLGSVELGKAKFSSPFFVITTSISGWFFLYSLAYFLEKIFLKKIFLYLGRCTMSIVALHFLGFKLTTFFQIYFYALPIHKLTSFPCLITSSGWWACYFFVSISFCLLMNCFYTKISSVIIRNK